MFSNPKFAIFSRLREELTLFNISIVNASAVKKIFSETYIVDSDDSKKCGLDSLYFVNFEVFTDTS